MAATICPTNSIKMVGVTRFELAWGCLPFSWPQIRSETNYRLHSEINWSQQSDLNQRPMVYKTIALPLSYAGICLVTCRHCTWLPWLFFNNRRETNESNISPLPNWWSILDSNQGHSRCKRDALINWAKGPSGWIRNSFNRNQLYVVGSPTLTILSSL